MLKPPICQSSCPSLAWQGDDQPGSAAAAIAMAAGGGGDALAAAMAAMVADAGVQTEADALADAQQQLLRGLQLQVPRVNSQA
jgi:hypothetical protein